MIHCRGRRRTALDGDGSLRAKRRPARPFDGGGFERRLPATGLIGVRDLPGRLSQDSESGFLRLKAARLRRVSRAPGRLAQVVRLGSGIVHAASVRGGSLVNTRRTRVRSCGRAGPRRPSCGGSGQGGRLGVGELPVHHVHHVRQTSMPMRWPVWPRPQRTFEHRVAQAELHRKVDLLGARESLGERVDRLVDHRHQYPVDDEPGAVRHRNVARSCRRRSASACAASNVASEVCSARISSTSSGSAAPG